MIERAIQAQHNFRIDRPKMDEANTVDFLIKAIYHEAEELTNSPPEYMDEETYLKQELADVFLFAFALADKLAGDQTTEDFIASIVLEKIARNSAKYPASYFQEDEYIEGVIESGIEWNNIRGNQQFYE